MALNSALTITPHEVAELIDDYAYLQAEYRQKYDRYKGQVPIKNREKEEPAKLNNNLAHDFRGNIVDGFTGYLFGKPVTYSVNTEYFDGSESQLARVNNELRGFRVRTNLAELDAQTGKMASICGSCGRLVHFDGDGNVSATLVKPWDCIFLYNSQGKVSLAIHNFSVSVGDETTFYAHVYDKTHVAHFVKPPSDTWQLDPQGGLLNGGERRNPALHRFDEIPLIQYSNNAERQGDFDKVETLIDAYDRVVSDADNEFEEFRLALLMLLDGADIDEEEAKKAKDSGVLVVPTGDAKYVVKDLPVEFFRELLDRLEKNIYRFAQFVDMSSENFSGNATSGIARMYQLLNMENKCSGKERQFVGASQRQWKVICSGWEKMGISLDYETIDIQFTRNLPVDVKYSAETLAKLKGLVPLETAYAQMPFIDDVVAVANQMREEQEELVDLDDNT